MAAQIATGLAAGALLAAGFLGTLWLTATTALSGRSGLVLFVLAALLRAVVVAAGIVALARFSGPFALVAGLVAFIAVRTVVVSRMRASIAAQKG
jgi:F1F0 ATPase subunit 2